jgi:hypothetical protein
MLLQQLEVHQSMVSKDHAIRAAAMRYFNSREEIIGGCPEGPDCSTLALGTSNVSSVPND